MQFLNESKRQRAEAVVANPAKFDPESVEIKALGIVNARDEKYSFEEKIREVYKILGGVIGEVEWVGDEDKKPETPKKKGKKAE